MNTKPPVDQGSLAEWDQASGDSPCRECRGRGYDRRNPDEPCQRCDGECVEPAW